ncbi:MAG: hypothetical protein FWD69_15405 [Polyangiaceae bacterium]|nr:hypothetical protein [Polyangiaceae bacterium]
MQQPLRDEHVILLANSRIPAWLAFFFVANLLAAHVLDGNNLFTYPDRSPSFGAAWWIGFALIVLAAIPRRVEVGPEGLNVGWLLPPRLVRYDVVARAKPDGRHGVTLEFATGDELRIRHSLFGGDASRMLLARMWSTLVAGVEVRLTLHERALLGRGHRAIDTWSVALSMLTGATGGSEYRCVLTSERLLAIVENPGLTTEVRVAAAVALGPIFHVERRDVFMRITEGSVDSRLTSALDKLLAMPDVSSASEYLARAEVALAISIGDIEIS